MSIEIGRRALLLTIHVLVSIGVATRSASGQPLDSCAVSKYQTLIEEWERLTAPEMMGAEGVDAGSTVVEGIAKRPIFLGGKTWFPVNPERQTICGTFDDSKVFDVTEFDWNIFIKPAPAYAFVIDPAQLPRKNGLKIENCPTDAASKCLEVEVGARKEYFQQQPIFNSFLPQTLGSSVLRNGPVCVSGPWVQDDNHNQHPEIHPSEQIWWRFPGSSGALHLMVAQDASARFAQKNDFAFESPATPQFRVWSSRPVASRFTVAFSVPLSGNTILNLEELARQDVVELPTNDTGDLTVRDGTDAGFTVRKPAGGARRVKLALDWACRQDEKVVGTFAVTSTVAASTGSNPGFYLVRLAPPGDPPLTPPQQPANAPQTGGVELDVVPNSLRRVVINGKATLAADVVPTETSGRTPAPVKSVRLMEPELRALSGQPTAGAPGTRKYEVPVGATPSSVEINLASGGTARVQLPAIGMSARLDDPSPLEPTAADAAAVAAFGRVTGLWEGSEVPFGRVMRTRGWELEVVPTYGLVKDGRVAVEEDAALTLDLSAAVEREGATRARVFGSQTPFAATWTVTARDLSAAPGAQPPPPGPAQVTLAPSAHTGKDGRATITASSETTRLVEVEAAATVADVYNLSSTVRTTLWNHYLAGTREVLRDGLISTVARRYELSPETITNPARGQRPADRDKRRRAGSLRTLITQVAGDGRITVDEAQQVLTFARDNAPTLKK
jgi:hypothetical protein